MKLKPLSAHEKKLMLFFGVAVAAGLHLIFFKVVFHLDQRNRRELLRIEGELAEARLWISQKDLWLPRIAWLEQNMKSLPSGNPALALQKTAQTTAVGAGLKIEEQILREAKPGLMCTVVANRMRLTGTLEQVLRWLTDVYQPEKGIAVTSLVLKLSPEPPKMAVEAEVGQFFRVSNP